jgi:hypothetical protein
LTDTVDDIITRPSEETARARHLFVEASSAVPAPIVRIDLVTGERMLWRELAPIDPAGVFVVDKVQLSADGAAHVYSNRRVISWLVLAEGLE